MGHARSAKGMIRPAETVQKLLLSTPTNFTGEYESADFRVSLAWPGYANRSRQARFQNSPLGREFLVISFATQPTEKRAGVVIPNYEPTGEFIAAMMAVLFGKRFDSHGALEMSGHFYVPELSSTSEPCEPKIPFHGQKQRADYGTPFQLSELKRFRTIIEDEAEDPATFSAFYTASLFYVRALRAAVLNPEVAYLHLITAGERLSEVIPFDKEASLDASTRNALHRIEKEIQGGTRIAALFRGRMLQVRRRYCHLLCSSVEEEFFKRREAENEWGALQLDGFAKVALSAYDLRSRYVHTGSSFGNWIEPRFGNEERQAGKPYLPKDRSMETLLQHAPTLVGLERLTRAALLKIAMQLGADLRVDGSDTSGR